MVLLSPFWLLALLPFAIAAALVMLGRRPPKDVPFLQLWKTDMPREAARSRFTTPPVGVWLVLLAALMGIFAASRPAFRQRGGALTIVLDAGVSMSAMEATESGARLRFVALADAVARDVTELAGGDTPITLIAVGGGATNDVVRTTAAELPAVAAAIPPTALDTVDDVMLAARSAARANASSDDAAAEARPAVVVLTDRALGTPTSSSERPTSSSERPTSSSAKPTKADEDVGVPGTRIPDAHFSGLSNAAVVIAPESPLKDVAIQRFAVRRGIGGQALVRLTRAGDSSRADATRVADATLILSAGGTSTETPVTLPAAGASRDIFLPLPPGTAEIKGTLLISGADPSDLQPANNRADLIAERDWPMIEPAIPVGDLQRLLDRYARLRPPGPRSPRVRLVAIDSSSATAADALHSSPGVAMPPAGTPTAATTVIAAADHPIVSAVGDWRQVAPHAARAVDGATRVAPAGWQALLSDSAGPLLAVNETSLDPTTGRTLRQAWTVLGPEGWSQTPAYVVFWSALLDWVGESSASRDSKGADAVTEPTSFPLADLTPDWKPVELAPGPANARYWPGVYERAGDGARRAFGPAPSIAETQTLTAAARRERLAQALASGERRTPLSGWILLISAACILGAALSWRRARRGD